MASSTKRLAYDAALLGSALILTYLESIIPLHIFLPVPGFRLGLPNLAIMCSWRWFGYRDALRISLFRLVIQGMLFGSITSFAFSLCGTVASLLVLLCCSVKRCPFSIFGVSVISSAAHQVGQILIASALFSTTALFFTYLPWLLLCALLTGTLIGFLTQCLQGGCNKTLHRKELL